MLTSLAKKVFGSRNDRLLKQYRKEVAKINALEPQMQALSDEELQAKTAEFKQRLAEGSSLDDLLVEAFAVCREAGSRVLGMRHFDVQLIGGMVLHQGKIAEMRPASVSTRTTSRVAAISRSWPDSIRTRSRRSRAWVSPEPSRESIRREAA